MLTSLQPRDAAHAALLEALRASATSPARPLVVAANEPHLRRRRRAGAATSCPASYGGRGTSSRSASKELDESPSDDELHQIRIRTKRARYAAEAAAPIVGKPARAFAHAAAGLQDVLGDLNDAVVAARWLDEWAASTVRRTPGARGARRPGAAAARSARPLAPGLGGARGTELRAWM